MGLGWQFKSCPGQVGLCLFEVMFGRIQGCQATIVKKSEILGKEGGDIRDFWGDIRDFWGAGASLQGLEPPKAADRREGGCRILPSEEDSVSNPNPVTGKALRMSSTGKRGWISAGDHGNAFSVRLTLFPMLHLSLFGQTQKPPLPSPCLDGFSLNLSTEEWQQPTRAALLFNTVPFPPHHRFSFNLSKP